MMRGFGSFASGCAVRPHVHFAFRVRSFSILDDVKKNLENDEKLKLAREKLKQVHTSLAKKRVFFFFFFFFFSSFSFVFFSLVCVVFFSGARD